MPFRIALSGLTAASTDLEVTGNNIANATTNGFKGSRVEFADVYTNAVQETAASAAGQGVRVTSVAQQFSQGTIDFTSNNLDLAISGQGFFTLKTPDGSQVFSRSGAYSVDRDGYVINSGDDRLQIYAAISGVGGTPIFQSGALQDFQLPTGPSAPQATDEVTAAINLDSSKSAPALPFNESDPASYNFSTSTTVYDSLGVAHTAQLYYRKLANNSWEQYASIAGTTSAAQALDFDASGALINPAAAVTVGPFPPGTGAADLNIDFELRGLTQYGSAFAVNNLTQNGATSGRLSGLDIDAEGVAFARYTNGQSTALGKVALARFNNEQGLRQIGDSNWAESFSSGPAQLGEAGTGSFGQIQSGALEASNVDVATQLVKLITAQRSFQANAEVISTADAVTQTIINIR